MDETSQKSNMRFDPARLLHAYIVVGPDGSAREQLVRILAAAMVCSGTGPAPCGACRECRKSLRWQHPDILEVFKPADKSVFPIDSIRSLCADTIVLPNDAACKVYIIREAELLNTPAQNALLKTLEEPPAHCRFILPIEDPSLLLTTVRSRCAELRISGEAEESDEEADQEAEAFLRALIHSPAEGAAYLSGVDTGKENRDHFFAFLHAAAYLSTRMAAQGKLSPEVWSVLDRAFARAEVYRTYNMNAGYCVGMLTACLAALPRKAQK